MLLWLGCDDTTGPGGEVLLTSQLLPLAVQGTAAAPAPVTLWVTNDQRRVATVSHADGFSTLYARVEFNIGALVSIAGNPLGPSDSAQITITPTRSRYEVRLAPSNIELSPGAVIMTISYQVYGDRSVADGNPNYADRNAYSEALDLWLEVSSGEWQRAPGSSTPGFDTVTARPTETGRFLVAAPN